jgi:hypothetical protein
MRWKSRHKNCRVSVSLCALMAIGGYAAQAQGQARTAVEIDRRPQQDEARVKTDQDIFDFHSGFWMNLHHFLYQQALAQKAGREGRAVRGAGEVVSVEALNDEEKRVWATALESYQKNWVNRDLAFDGDLININYRLAELENQTTLKQSGLPDELIAALEQAAPIYRTHWWKGHDRVNRSWITDVASLIRKHGRILSEKLATAYREPWEKNPVRVDVSIYANGVGAYTTINPTLITISSADSRHQGPAALESIFHEASHAMMGAVRKGIESECAAQSKQVPRDLWHVTLFYTIGEIVKRALAENGQRDYEPYAYKQGLYQRAPNWRQYQQLMEKHWQPYLDGKSDFAQAIKQMVADL